MHTMSERIMPPMQVGIPPQPMDIPRPLLTTITTDHFVREHPVGDLVFRDAAPQPSSFNEAERTVEATIATNYGVNRIDQRGAFLEILDVAGADLSRLNGASVLDSHRQGGLENVIGTVAAVRTEGNAIIAKIKFSSRASAIMADVRDGVIRHVSIGYKVDRWEERQDNGKRTKVAVQWAPYEVSFVSIPADPNAGVRNDPAATTRSQPAPAERSEINNTIRTLGESAGVDVAIINGLIDRGASLDEARAELLDDLTRRSAATGIRSAHNDVTLDNPANRAVAMGEAMYCRIEPGHNPQPQARTFLHMSFRDMALASLRAAGVSATGLAADALIERALHTTSDFPDALGDTVGRTLMASYRAVGSGIKVLARKATLPDFRNRSRVKIDSDMMLAPVNEKGEFQSGTILDGKESYKLSTFGRIFGISRVALVNDDIGAFADIPRMLGQAAANFEAQQLVALLESNPAMDDEVVVFHTDHANLADAGAAPDETTLSTARLAMRKQKGLGDNLISVTPKYLLVPSELETAAEKLLSAIQATTTDDANPFAKLTLVVEPRLSNPTAWYIVADKGEVPGIEYAHLTGAEGPQITSRAGFEVDGIQTRVRLDFGAGWMDHRGWYRNAGE